ncbi:glycosyltransferase family 1 protein [Corynebacterium sp. 153RC1]|nr:MULTISPECIES: glycosyltransferase family 1 protein [unclassified Corynebacterium]MCQ9351813.1 glycosyltransferase family 1 protein [Corynebacterium sp. 209RC1]MCQ9354549.1 glycosyltransferase family 1 protein [Corynebacterium sp. 1222RC1]MCQ9356095.1 glycosyltransferase family 1 protein [Corynebacterium sp. 122RC1]MCQ9358727.1 glycosyltransferase family 1 protein [Corynebacterium sp. 142RC1]MCQ9360709.1 glycosyltransferase family 1 protein [Corynebacterium sp. 153RC1]
MRVAIIAESFLPNFNGVTNSVVQVIPFLRAAGHEVIVIAPAARDHHEEVSRIHGASVLRVPTIMMPRINSLPLGLPLPTLREHLAEFAPDVIHLASPFFLGGFAAFVASQMGVPTVAVFQTDIAGYTGRYHLAPLERATWAWTRAFHNRCALTLAPSTATIEVLERHGIERVHRWARGVDTELFQPKQACRRSTRITVGYVGRLAAEKGVHRLGVLAADPRFRVVIVGDGPEREALQRHMPNATFRGALFGEQLAQAYRDFDVFVHPGEFETFCQTIQEAHASGVPTIAPNQGGPRDLVVPDLSGELLPVDSFTQELPDAVVRAFEYANPQRIAASVANRRWEDKAHELLGFYELATGGAAHEQRWFDRLLHRG